MKLKIVIFFIFLNCFNNYAQFKFYGKINSNFENAVAYLSLINDCNKKDLFLTENILQEVKINSNSEFIFEGDFLDYENRIYKIHIDNCHDNIGDYKHLLNHCDDSKEIIFIANNNDTISFPLNDLSQIFCNIEQSSIQNSAILKIEELQENILTDLEHTKNDIQRQNIFNSYFKKIKQFSKKFNDPLVELYAYHLYANENSLSRDFYLKDLKKSNYYNDLLYRLKNKYSNTIYYNRYKNTLIKDQYPLLKSSKTTYKYLIYILSFLLLLSVLYNIYQNKIKDHKPISIIDYKKTLTKQEQKVFELMLNNSNKEIADKLFISLSTVKTHINNIYSKLSINSRKEIELYFKN